MSLRRILILSASLLSFLGTSNRLHAQGAGGPSLQGAFVAYSRATNLITLDLTQPSQSVPFKCAAAICAAALTNARAGDIVTLDVDRPDTPTSVTRVESVARPVDARTRVVAFGVSFIVLFTIAALAIRGMPWKFLIGADNRYSNSQCQIALWFGAVATMYLGTLALRIVTFDWGYLGGVGITANVAAITGLSALSFGGAKAITMAKVNTAAQAGLPAVKEPARQSSFRTDLFLNDKGRADFGDFQMILITVAAVAIFIGQAFYAAGILAMSHAVKLPDVDSSLLAGFGIGQGAYLVKKAALKAGDG